MDGNPPDSGYSDNRILLEFISDFIMLLGIAMLVWHALHVAGFMPPAPRFLFRPWNPEFKGGAVFVYVLAAVSISDYFAMLVIVSNRRRSEASASTLSPANKLVLRYAFAATVWIFILVLHLVQK